MKIIPGSRRRHYAARIGVLLVTAALIAGMAGFYNVGGGDALQLSQNLEIRTWYDLDAVRDNLDGNHILMNDLDSTTAGYDELASPTANGGNGWEPIWFYGAPSSGCDGSVAYPKEVGLTGTFDGQGYEIRDLFIDRPDEGYAGLFGIVDEGGIIENVSVVNVTVTGYRYVGSLVGVNYGTVSNSYSNGRVTGYDWVGGLVGAVGANTATVSNSYYNYDEVLINGENIITIGALFDEDFDEWLANDKFLDVNDRLSQENGYYVVNNVADFNELLVFGQNTSLKFRLKNNLDLATEPNFYIPYLAGEFDGNGHKISNLSFNVDFVSFVGLFGYLASGVKVTDLGVENVNVTGGDYVGGLVGGNEGTVSNSYSSGNVTGDDHVGGLVGAYGNVSNSFWDTETSGQATSAGGTGKNTTEMQDIDTFSGAAWDIIAVGGSSERNTAYIWNIVDDETYPFLSWEP